MPSSPLIGRFIHIQLSTLCNYRAVLEGATNAATSTRPGLATTRHSQSPSPYPPQQGQWNQGPYTPYPPQHPYLPQQEQWQQPITPNQQWSQQPYRQPSSQPKKKKSKLLLIIGIIVVLVLFASVGAGVLASHGGNPSASTTTNSSASSSNTSSNSFNTSSNSTSAPVVGKVGQTITVDSAGCTLVSVKTIAGDDFTQPKPGNEFIVVHVKIHNSNSQQTDYNTFDFHVKSGTGNVTDEEAIPPSPYTANNELNSGQLDPGGTVEGDIIFQVPVGDHKAELTWQPNFFGSTTQNAWNLGL
jgi:flagellar basal body-associated protein FliL